MKISVVIATYNQPEWLGKVLLGFACQSEQPSEIVIADDGSDDRTAECIQRFAADGRLSVQHVWHDDLGFRKCEILNHAISNSQGDYLIFTDGDCIPHRDLVRAHRCLARAERFLSGGYVKLPMSLSLAITSDDIISGRATDARWLVRHGMGLSKKLRLLNSSWMVGSVLDGITTTKPTFNGHNASAWKSDILKINGFDERMRYGGLDREIGERLENAGVRGMQIRHRAGCVHLDHARGYATPESLQRNRDLRDETIRSGLCWTDFGIKKSASSLSNGRNQRGEVSRPHFSLVRFPVSSGVEHGISQ